MKKEREKAAKMSDVFVDGNLQQPLAPTNALIEVFHHEDSFLSGDSGIRNQNDAKNLYASDKPNTGVAKTSTVVAPILQHATSAQTSLEQQTVSRAVAIDGSLPSKSGFSVGTNVPNRCDVTSFNAVRNSKPSTSAGISKHNIPTNDWGHKRNFVSSVIEPVPALNVRQKHSGTGVVGQSQQGAGIVMAGQKSSSTLKPGADRRPMQVGTDMEKSSTGSINARGAGKASNISHTAMPHPATAASLNSLTHHSTSQHSSTQQIGTDAEQSSNGSINTRGAGKACNVSHTVLSHSANATGRNSFTQHSTSLRGNTQHSVNPAMTQQGAGGRKIAGALLAPKGQPSTESTVAKHHPSHIDRVAPAERKAPTSVTPSKGKPDAKYHAERSTGARRSAGVGRGALATNIVNNNLSARGGNVASSQSAIIQNSGAISGIPTPITASTAIDLNQLISRVRVAALFQTVNQINQLVVLQQQQEQQQQQQSQNNAEVPRTASTTKPDDKKPSK